MFQIAKDMNGPPGITHPLLIESYAWIDERLREMYYSYALTNAKYESTDLLKQNWDWVDNALENMSKITDEDLLPPRPACLVWVNYRSDAQLEHLEEDISLQGSKRKRSESDISDYEDEAARVINRLECQSPFPTGKYINKLSNPKFISGNCDEEEYEFVSEISSISSHDVNYDSSEDEPEIVEALRIAKTESFMKPRNPAVSYALFDSYYSYDLY